MFLWKHTQEKGLSPASFRGVDLGGTSATEGQLKTLHVSQGLVVSLFFLAFLLSKARFCFQWFGRF